MYCKRVKLKSGQMRWVCVADGPRNPATGKRNQIERRGKTQREAKKRVEDAINDLKNHGLNKKLTKDMTLLQLNGWKPTRIQVKAKIQYVSGSNKLTY